MVCKDQAANPLSCIINKLDLWYQKEAAHFPALTGNSKASLDHCLAPNDTHTQGRAVQITTPRENRFSVPIGVFNSIFLPYSREGYDGHLLPWLSILTSQQSEDFHETPTPRGRGRLGTK